MKFLRYALSLPFFVVFGSCSNFIDSIGSTNPAPAIQTLEKRKVKRAHNKPGNSGLQFLVAFGQNAHERRKVSYAESKHLFVDNTPLFERDDITAVKLQKHSWRLFPENLKIEFLKLPREIVEQGRPTPVYSMKVELSSLGQKMYLDSLNKHSEAFVIAMLENKIVMASTTKKIANQVQPVFYMGQKSSESEARALFESIARNLERR